MFGEMQNHFSGRHRAPGFNEAEMPLRNFSFEREFELAEPS